MQMISDGVGFAVINRMLQVCIFTPCEISQDTGASDSSILIMISILTSKQLIRQISESPVVYEVPEDCVDKLRCFADRNFCPAGPGVACRIVECLFKEGHLTIDLAATLVGTTRRRATWEMCQLLRQGLVGFGEKEKTLEILLPKDPGKLKILRNRYLDAVLPLPGNEFVQFESLWYWAARSLLESGQCSDFELHNIENFIRRAQDDIPTDHPLTPFCQATLLSLTAYYDLIQRNPDSATDKWNRAKGIFRSLGLERSTYELSELWRGFPGTQHQGNIRRKDIPGVRRMHLSQRLGIKPSDIGELFETSG